ncbi:MAG TPA: HEAT repeat domain-containing protein [Terriglobia bacterium]|nr:HEAT repeat domain-containing protein [Terriglobia bacterium]
MKQTKLLFLLALFLIYGPVKDAVGQQTSNPLALELKSPDAGIRAKAARQLGDSGDISTVPALAADLTDPSSKVRAEVIVALSKLHTNQSLDALLKATRDTDPGIRSLAVEATIGWYTGNIPAVGFESVVSRSYHSAMNRFQGNVTRINPGMQVDPRAVSALEEAMQDTRSIDAARKAAWGLGVLTARSAVPDLIKAAHSYDPDLAINALNALSKIKDISAGPQLVDVLASTNNGVKQTAAITVGILRTKAAAPKLESMYQNDRNKETRVAALDGLAYIGDPATYSVFVSALSSRNPDEREYAAEGLARAGNRQALPELKQKMQTEKKEGVKLGIFFAETSLGQTQHLQDLVEALPSRSWGAVAQSYLIELARQKDLLQELYPYLSNRDATTRRRLCYVLMYSGDASSIQKLQPLTRDRNSDVAAAALSAVRAIRARTNSAA